MNQILFTFTSSVHLHFYVFSILTEEVTSRKIKRILVNSFCVNQVVHFIICETEIRVSGAKIGQK